MEMNEVMNLIREEIETYQDINAPERMALSRLMSKLDSQKKGATTK